MDIVQEYVAYVKTHGSETAVAAVTAPRDGLLPSLSWLCYAAEVREDGMEPKLWEFKKSVRDAMNRLAITEDEDEPIETDPFTDPDEGLPLFVKYIKNPNKKKGENYYDVSLGKKPKACTVSTCSVTTSGWRSWRRYVPSTLKATTNPRRKSPRRPPSAVPTTRRMTFRPFVRRRTAPAFAFLTPNPKKSLKRRKRLTPNPKRRKRRQPTTTASTTWTVSNSGHSSARTTSVTR